MIDVSIQNKKTKSKEFIPFDSTGLPDEYRNEYESNPYNRQASGGFLGIGRRKEQEQLDLERDKYSANLYQRYYDETYNSEAAKAARERAAGLNPDLLGLDSASETQSNPLGQSDIDFANPVQQVADMSNILLNIASLGLSIPHGLADLKTTGLQNQGLLLQNAATMEALASGHTSDFPDLPKEAGNLDENLLESAVKYSSRAEDLAKMYFPAMKDKKQAFLRDWFVKTYKANQNTQKSKLATKVLQNQNNRAQDAIDHTDVTSATFAAYQAYELKSAENRAWLETELNKFYQTEGVADEYRSVLQNELTARGATAGEDINTSAYNMEVFNSKSGKSEALAKGEEAIWREYKAKQNQTDLETIQTLENYFIDNASLSDKTILLHIFHPRKTAEYYHNKKAYKQAYKRVYGTSPTESTGIDVPGVGRFGIH